MRQTPLSKRLASFIMRGAFPTLFSYGKADFNMPRSRIVTLAAYAKHMCNRLPRFTSPYDSPPVS